MKPGKDHPSWLHKAMAEGGRVKRAEGGKAPYAFGDLDSGKSLKEASDTKETQAVRDLKKGYAKSAVGAAMTGYGRGLGRVPGALVLGSGVKDIAESLSGSTEARRLNEAADEAEGHRPARAKGGKLTAKARKHIKAKNFALPGRRYPIEDASHARNALARVSGNGTPAEKAKVRSAVHRKYPGIGKD